MKEKKLLIPVKIHASEFRRFAFFDTFYHQKHWRRPLLFALVMAVFSGPCFAFSAHQEGAMLLGFVLLAIGFGLPLTYLLNYWLSLRQQMKRMDLRGVKIVYTLQIGLHGIQASADGQSLFYPWENIYMVYRFPSCMYLYVSRNQAYLLPNGPFTQPTWELLQSHLPTEKIQSFRNDIKKQNKR